MEYTNEFLARVYGAYFWCNTAFFNSDTNCWESGSLNNPHNLVPKMTNDPEDEDRFDFNRRRLALTPLSEISDEDAIEVAKMFDASAPTSIFGRKVISYITDMANKPGWFNPDFEKIRLAFDKLREWGYDCGYGEIPSLIDAGIAIKNQQP